MLITGAGGSQRYNAYGSTRSGAVPTKYQFTGQEADSGTGLVYMKARYYDPVIGQFISPDTIVPDPADVYAYNRYMYARGNPLRYTDPTGHVWETIWDAINIGIGAAALVKDVRNGEWKDAAWDAGGLLVDVAATAVPFIPGGAASIIKAGRAADDVIDAMNAVDNVADAVKITDGAIEDAQVLAQIESVWDTANHFERGKLIEKALQHNLPPNFPVIDRFENGVATSIKSIDLGAASYQKPAALASKIGGYINALAEYTGRSGTWARAAVPTGSVTKRVLQLAIPTNATDEQLQVLQQAYEYGSSIGVDLEIIIMH